MPHKVFISYRREDAKWQAREVYRALTGVLPRDHVFMDIDSIPLGSDFRKILKGWVYQCDMLLALIGPGWVGAVDPKTGQLRLKNPADFVRIEISEALVRDIPVVPVLLDGAPMPDGDTLPDDLKELIYRHAEFVDYAKFDDDVARLIRKLQLDGATAPPSRGPTATLASPAERMQAEGRINVDAKIVNGAPDGWFLPGSGKTEWFKDHDAGPEMVVVPTGSFMMGSPENEPERESLEKGTESPQHEVSIAQPLAVGRHAITRGQFATFIKSTGYKTDGGAYVWTGSTWEHDPKASWCNPGFAQDDSHPVVCVSWDDAKAYAGWLTQQAGQSYRLLTEAEWEYAARAGTTTPFWWGTAITSAQANYDGTSVYAGGGSKGEYRRQTVPVDSFKANAWGLYNVHGNVWEWCEDVWHDTYASTPTDGSAWLQGEDQDLRMVRGGSWYLSPQYLRSAFRDGRFADDQYYDQGFRLARTLNNP